MNHTGTLKHWPQGDNQIQLLFTKRYNQEFSTTLNSHNDPEVGIIWTLFTDQKMGSLMESNIKEITGSV